MRLDLASRCGDHLVLFGWILGLAAGVSRAEVQHGDMVIDLLQDSFPVPRPDVTAHFTSSGPWADDHHGFYVAFPLPVNHSPTSYARLSVTYATGQRADGVWPVNSGDGAVGVFFQQNKTNLAWLLECLPAASADWLRLHVPAFVVPRAAKPKLSMKIDLCCFLDEQILLASGSLVTSISEPVFNVRVSFGTLDISTSFQLHNAPESSLARPVGAPIERRFTLVLRLTEGAARSNDVIFDIEEGQNRVRERRVLLTDRLSALNEFADRTGALPPDVVLNLIEILAAKLDPAVNWPTWLTTARRSAVDRLPASIEAHASGVLLFCDNVLAIGNEGLFVSGWFHSGQDEIAAVTCHSSLQSRRVDETWVRNPRKDVTEHLMNRGIPGAPYEPGFAFYVPFPTNVACYLSVSTARGQVVRVRLPLPTPLTTMAGIRAVLSSFNTKHPSLRALIDAHVGPAVENAWAHRTPTSGRLVIQRFGPRVSNPAVSIIVPLYGRCDFADYQMAVFADDPDFQSLELIYFVDDPTLFDEFRPQCHDLYATYRVPFTLVTGGVNFGFAGANNRAATVASGAHLLLMNSDVFPKRPGWVRDMLAIYAKLVKPGLLGVKLLYEDGSIQHAGMAFRRHAPWGDLWLNEHPHKGQGAKGLTGLQPAAAVTAACVLVDAALYRELDGLSEDYIIGDFEDSDFCLRAAAAGRTHWVALDIELYHLERQSQNRIGDSNWRTNLTLYNCWLHNQRWGAVIGKIAP